MEDRRYDNHMFKLLWPDIPKGWGRSGTPVKAAFPVSKIHKKKKEGN